MSQGDLSGFFGDGFDSNTVEPADEFPVLPVGEYPVLIEEAELKPTQANDGHLIKLRLKVLAGNFKDRVLFENLNIQNKSEIAVKIALQALSALCKATIGSAKFADTSQIKGKVCVAHVKVKNGENAVRTYSPYADAASVQPVQQQQPPVDGYGGGLGLAPQQQPPLPAVQYEPQPQQAPPIQPPAQPQMPFRQPQPQGPQQPVARPAGADQPAVPWARQ